MPRELFQLPGRFDLGQGILVGPFLDQIGMLSQQVLAEEFPNDRTCRVSECPSITWNGERIDHSHVREAHMDRASQRNLNARLRSQQKLFPRSCRPRGGGRK